jgi:hypothetical protein
MKPTDFWKNFTLGEEISVSGNFIYNGLRRYHEMSTLDYVDEIFEFFYNLSIGFERLLKIAIVLFEHSDSINQEELEKSLITHNHLDLLTRLKKHIEVNLGAPQIDLLNMFGTFYRSFRYDRFSLTSIFDRNKECKLLYSLLQKHLNADVPSKIDIIGTENKDRYRNFIHKNVIKISRILYKIIKDRAGQLNLYTDELRNGSKSESIFLREIKISNEDILWKELLIFFMNTKETSKYFEFLRGIPPLDFDPALLNDYLDCFKSDSLKSQVMDELEHHYEEMEGKKSERLELMSIIGNHNFDFDIGEEDCLDDDEQEQTLPE